ncbi:hypothetical protein BH24ACI2_BH24ACI2_15500 [soil metagenome]
MKCPHCLENFHHDQRVNYINSDKDGAWGIIQQRCPACNRLVLKLINGLYVANTGQFQSIYYQTLIYPKGSLRQPCPAQVPNEIAEDYNEACLVIQDSPKASAALSRRALQHLLRDAANVKHGNLASEIQEVLDSGKLPTHIAESIDAVRNIGNFSAHPMKSQNTGVILPVEPEEAEWILEVLESLFDFYYVQPDITKKKRDALNQKLAEAGKPPMK